MQKFKAGYFFLFFMCFTAGKAWSQHWKPLFNDSLTNAIFPAGVWTEGGVPDWLRVQDL